MNYLLTIEYEGTRYEGWQRQKKTTQTIQGKLEQVLSRMTEKEIEIDGAGRTDAGVHAKNQTASVHLAKKWDPKEIFAIYESVSAGRYLCKVCGTGIGAVSCKTLGGRKMLFLPDWNG